MGEGQCRGGWRRSFRRKKTDAQQCPPWSAGFEAGVLDQRLFHLGEKMFQAGSAVVSSRAIGEATPCRRLYTRGYWPKLSVARRKCQIAV